MLWCILLPRLDSQLRVDTLTSQPTAAPAEQLLVKRRVVVKEIAPGECVEG